MKKFATALLIAALSTGASAQAARKPAPSAAKPIPRPAPAPELPVFDFLGHNTETPSTVNPKCPKDKDGSVSCTDFANPTLAGVTLKWLSLSFYNNKLYRVIGSGGRYTFPGLLSAFSKKYGPPKLETRKWQNRAGAVLDNDVATWQFKGGILELSSIGSRIDDVDFYFISLPNSPPSPEQKIDF